MYIYACVCVAHIYMCVCVCVSCAKTMQETGALMFYNMHT